MIRKRKIIYNTKDSSYYFPSHNVADSSYAPTFSWALHIPYIGIPRLFVWEWVSRNKNEA
jgi:hypothetical protein